MLKSAIEEVSFENLPRREAFPAHDSREDYGRKEKNFERNGRVPGGSLSAILLSGGGIVS
jgi:hypothetical protein